MDSEGDFWHIIPGATSPALAARPQPYCWPRVSPSAHAAHVQWGTRHSGNACTYPLLQERAMLGQKRKEIGCKRGEMLLNVMRDRLSTSRVRWKGGMGMQEQHGGLKHPPPPPYEGSPSPAQGTRAQGQAPLSLQGCTAPTTHGISPPTQAGISSTSSEMLGRAPRAGGSWRVAGPHGTQGSLCRGGVIPGSIPGWGLWGRGNWWRWEAMRGLSMGMKQHRLRPLGQTCRSMNTGHQWDQGQEREGQEVALQGCRKVRRYPGRELGPGEQGAGRAGGVGEGCTACPGTYTFWWSLTRFRRTLICKRNTDGW